MSEALLCYTFVMFTNKKNGILVFDGDNQMCDGGANEGANEGYQPWLR